MFILKNENLVLSQYFDVSFEKALNEVPEALGKDCPDAVYPNYQDYDYAVTTLDDTSFKTVRGSLSKTKDSFFRQMLWQTLWDMVRTTKLSAYDYSEILSKHLKNETDLVTLKKVLQNVSKFRSYVPQKNEDQKQKYNKIFADLEKTLQRKTAIGLSRFRYAKAVVRSTDYNGSNPGVPRTTSTTY